MSIDCTKCPICLDVMVQAYVLRCGHSFCELCLDEAVNWDDRCPECRRYTHGICIPNLRLNECIYNSIRENAGRMHEFTRRAMQNQYLMALRKDARSALFSVFYNNRRPLTLSEVEEKWKEQSGLHSLPDDLRTEMFRIIHSDTKFFEVVIRENEARIMFKDFDSEENIVELDRSIRES